MCVRVCTCCVRAPASWKGHQQELLAWLWLKLHICTHILLFSAWVSRQWAGSPVTLSAAYAVCKHSMCTVCVCVCQLWADCHGLYRCPIVFCFIWLGVCLPFHTPPQPCLALPWAQLHHRLLLSCSSLTESKSGLLTLRMWSLHSRYRVYRVVVYIIGEVPDLICFWLANYYSNVIQLKALFYVPLCVHALTSGRHRVMSLKSWIQLL